MDKAYDANADISLIDNTLYIARRERGRASDWYDHTTKGSTLWNAVPCINQYESLMCCMKELPDIGVVARRADAAVPFPPVALKTVPMIFAEFPSNKAQ